MWIITNRSQPEVWNRFDDFIPPIIDRLAYFIIFLFNFQNFIAGLLINLYEYKILL